MNNCDQCATDLRPLMKINVDLYIQRQKQDMQKCRYKQIQRVVRKFGMISQQ